MTIKPSSSPATNPTTTLIDSAGQSIVLAKMIGKGGEGSVYDVAGSAALVAKVYHKRPLDAQHVEKLEAMVAYWSEGLEAIAAWPRSLLYEPQRRQPCGLLMTKMQGARPLHELYGTTNRRLHFPEAGWHHLILAARPIKPFVRPATARSWLCAIVFTCKSMSRDKSNTTSGTA